MLHVLEHVDAGTAGALVGEAVRIARRRVVVAVPYEAEPTALYGHLHRGGWLVLSHPDPSPPASPAAPPIVKEFRHDNTDIHSDP